MITNIPNEFLEKGFEYPRPYLKLIELNLINFDYWYMMNEKQALKRLKGLRKRYPERFLIPFARRDDNDDIACFDVEDSSKVQIIHDFASIGYEQRKTYKNVWKWFLEAVNELVDKAEEDV